MDVRVSRSGPFHSIARAGRLATVQQWNIPEVCTRMTLSPARGLTVCVGKETDTGPTRITINVETEIGDDIPGLASAKTSFFEP